MNKYPAAMTVALSSCLKKIATLLFVALATSAQAELVVNEGFFGYNSSSDIKGQAVTGAGLSGNWDGSQFYRTEDTGLSMSGVASSGGNLRFPGKAGADTTPKALFAPFTSPLSSATTYYGSYLFSTTSSGTTGKTVGALGVSDTGTGVTDNNASFTWAGNGYNNVSTVEGPGIRAEGSAWQTPGISLINDTTYLMLFEFNATSGTTSAWVLNQAQLSNFALSLDAATLNGLTPNTEDASGLVWSGSATSGKAIDPMNYLIMLGSIANPADSAFVYRWDEIRLSDTSLSEAVTAVPEPSTIATVGLALGIFALRGVRRRPR